MEAGMHADRLNVTNEDGPNKANALGRKKAPLRSAFLRW